MLLAISFQTAQIRINLTSYSFGRDVHIPTLANQLHPKLRYLRDVSALLSVEMMRYTYMLVAVNLKKARDKQPSKVIKEIPKFKVSDLVLLRNHKKHSP